MGFFDRFGAGGGKLDIKPQALQYLPGQPLTGTVVFVAGSRPQNITNIKLKLTVSLTEQVKTAQGVQSQSQTKDVCPEATLSGSFQTVVGQTYEFPFQFALPQAIPHSQQGHTAYHLRVSADIPGEVDPGDSQEIHIAPGAGAPQVMPAKAAQPIAQPMIDHATKGKMAQPVTDHAGKGKMAQPVTDHAVHGKMPPVAIGAKVHAQWQDGNWYPAQVVAIQNGMIGVDWIDARLGASSWLQPTQVRG